ncbi:MAG: cell division protein ZapE [Gammaproteobacteria bacterium]|nr:cell division protein ZapE [Gammaproteobacteria bacterium]
MTTPTAAHERNLAVRDFRPDPAQAAALRELDALHRRLARMHGTGPGLVRRVAGALGISGAASAGSRSGLSALLRRRAPQLGGLYLWGGVGRGKTYLMDLFHECLPLEAKLRLHFHRFMLRVHDDLRRMSGVANPLQRVADGMADEAAVLCFDEFFVSDIGDAMILGELVGALLDRGVTLVCTSNVEPRRLYENGLQRRRFLPAIERIETRMRVLHLDGATDHRLRVLSDADTYQWPLSEAAEARLAECFAALAPQPPREAERLEVNGREIRTLRCTDDVAWFDFSDLCEGPRSQNDYVELSREFHAVVLSAVPVFDRAREDAARRFIGLIDELYDRNVKLVLSAQGAIGDLYQGERLRVEFDRTASRLREMQSLEYLGRSHKP